MSYPRSTTTLSRRSFVGGAALLGLGLAAWRTPLALANDASAADVPVRIAAMKGPTAMGMVKLMDDVDSGTLNAPYTFDILASTDEIAPLIAKGEVDIACVPANLAAVLWNNTDGAVTTLAINTLGVLYLATAGEPVESMADLAGRTIYASGKGATPEYALIYLLEANGINPDTDVTIEWKSEHAECVAALVQDPTAWALLPQPFATTAQVKNPDIACVFDLTAEWDAVQESLPEEDRSALLTGVTVARTAFLDEHPEAVDLFLERYEESVTWVNEHVDEAAELVGAYDIVVAEVAKKALPACSIVYIDGTEMQQDLAGYLGVLFDQNPKAVGGTLPGDAFYYLPAVDAE